MNDLDNQIWVNDSEVDWAEASVAMTPEFMDQEDWENRHDEK